MGDDGLAAAARARLVEALIATGRHDRRAFDLLYSLTSAKLFGICLRICGDRQAAEDVMQDVYLTIWRRAEGYEPGRSSPITWLGTIARNRAIDWRRAHPQRAQGGAGEAEAIADPGIGQERTMLLDEVDRLLQRCIDELGERQRGVIRDAFFGGLTYADLARREGVPLGTMKSWIRRALIQLRDCVDDDDRR